MGWHIQGNEKRNLFWIESPKMSTQSAEWWRHVSCLLRKNSWSQMWEFLVLYGKTITINLKEKKKKKQGSATRKHNLHQPRLCRATHFSEEEEILVVEIKCSCVITGQRGFHWCSLKRWDTAHCQTDKIKALKAAELNGKESVGVWYRA